MYQIGVLVGSIRNPRCCPQIAEFIVNRLKAEHEGTSSINFNIIDLQKQNLPFYDEPGIPAMIKDPMQYEHEHTRRWSKLISAQDGFIFVSPQYNWGYPAGLKNAIDYLSNEWKEKKATVVTYGSHGGDKCNEQLTQVLTGIGLEVTSKTVQLSFPNRDILFKAAQGENINIENGKVFESSYDDISESFEELVALISNKT
ncbi:flavin-dependent quinone reductase KNAG_0H03840 [Huiozyma naganishii CBS 8797]|uniref:NADPH-dependent FMN reductase-like domain-containing protein n=1 Tax=Huiozyma naganishii (strain ATCC MYA-139 / BCRC 22969 / CBS 8797 / KCTC 17520 / NBRC 10181 / NCYC 3082 / Yp74L-3) TaxID=1071383 RepID=J7RPW3_HUIN7|nr:hypothetical protein KNAG_0H03840 [Kazachstania naganishii CBS 8797]CCK71798.1 hypothetical protein KNAG_0H03840 [Kazachstania naganishii CBS 8797]